MAKKIKKKHSSPDPLSNEPWFKNAWRPAMSWSYLAVCVFDFIIAPVLVGIMSYYTGTYHEWRPLTLQGGGLYHMAMMAIVGAATWSRGLEKRLLMDKEETKDYKSEDEESDREQDEEDDRAARKKKSKDEDEEDDNKDTRHKGEDA